MIKVIKRDGSIVDYDASRFYNALIKCGISKKDAKFIEEEIDLDIKKQTHNVTVEFIQDLVEKNLMEYGFYDQAKAYILYRNDHHKQRIPYCQKPSESFVPEYTFCDEVADKQAIDWEWTHLENDPTEDVAGLISYATPQEMHGVIYASKILTTYEGFLGEEYWSGRFQRIFPRHEFRNAGLVLARMETQTHAKVYRKFNEALHLEVEGFYEEYKKDPALSERMKFIGRMINDPNDLLSLAAFSLLEGVSLFCIFAFFKHFQSNGKNQLPKTVANFNFSARDETLHSSFGASCYKVLRDESFLSKLHRKQLEDKIKLVANELREHEYAIIDNLLPKDNVSGISVLGLKAFVDSRVDFVFDNLQIDHLPRNYIPGLDSISSWFDKGIERYIYNDNFAKGGREYTRKFTANDFNWDENLL